MCVLHVGHPKAVGGRGVVATLKLWVAMIPPLPTLLG